MKKCKSCQKEIDPKATKCPYCQTDQRNWFTKHPILTVLLVLIVIGIFGSSVGDKKSNTNVVSNNPATTTKDNTTQEEKVGKVGESVLDKDISFTVTNITTANSLGNQYTKTEAQGIFYVISLKIENKSNETKTIDSSMIALLDQQGRKFDRSVEGQTAKGLSQGKVDLFLQQVQPGLGVNGDIVFDIPREATGLKLVVKGSIFSTGQKIDLGK